MLLVTKFDAMEKYLEERLFFEDPDLQKMVTQLGLEVDEAAQTISDLNEAQERRAPRRYGGFFV